MKKKYCKPQVCYENFELSANIAMCELYGTNLAEAVCPVIDPEGFIIFQDAVSGCQQTPAIGGDNICYGVPNGGDYTVFVS